MLLLLFMLDRTQAPKIIEEQLSKAMENLSLFAPALAESFSLAIRAPERALGELLSDVLNDCLLHDDHRVQHAGLVIMATIKRDAIAERIFDNIHQLLSQTKEPAIVEMCRLVLAKADRLTDTERAQMVSDIYSIEPDSSLLALVVAPGEIEVERVLATELRSQVLDARSEAIDALRLVTIKSLHGVVAPSERYLSLLPILAESALDLEDPLGQSSYRVLRGLLRAYQLQVADFDGAALARAREPAERVFTQGVVAEEVAFRALHILKLYNLLERVPVETFAAVMNYAESHSPALRDSVTSIWFD